MSIKSPPFRVARWCSLSAWKLKIGEIRKDPEATKILLMRLTLVLFLICAAVAVAVNTYKKLLMNQQNAYESSFHSVAQSALNSVVDSFERINLGIQQMSSTYSELFPEPETWPFVAWAGFANVVAPLGKISSVEGMAIFPIVRPHQAANFTQHMLNYYDSRPAEKEIFFPFFFPNGSIWVQNETVLEPSPIVVTSGVTPPRDFFVPMLQYSLSQLAGYYYAGYDIHSSQYFSNTVEDIMACARRTHNYSTARRSCGAISEVQPTPYPEVAVPDPVVTDMAALFAHPIFPANNQSRLVGFVGGSLSWAELLRNVVPRFVPDVDCVVKAHNTWFTFTIGQGPPRFKGLGDLHEHKFSKYGICSGPLNPSVGVADSRSHMVFLYPTEEFYNSFFDVSPVQSTLVMIAIFALCSFLFYVYDMLMKREFGRRQAVLDTKRRFVRFISHEIRTPLNTVRLGLKLFEEELIALMIKMNRYPSCEMSSVVKSALVSWKSLTDEILESSDSAVEVLDDLLNYDKIEIGTLRLEFGLFDMRELVTKSTNMMQVHAKQKGISLVLQCESECSLATSHVTPYNNNRGSFAQPSPRLQPNYLASIEEARGADSAVVGDATRLSQVLRNLISNALKFTPSKGVVTVSVETIPTFSAISEKVRLSSPLFQNVLPAGTIRVSVTDSGAGLDEQQLAQICKEGMQFNANELQAGQGSGLGLFISKGIVEQHGGCLTVASEGLGKGVTFTVELPLFKDEAGLRSARSSIRNISKCPSSVSSIHPSGDASRVSSGKAEGLPLLLEYVAKKILVVDDSPFNRKMLVRLLTSKGYDCAQAEDGADAIRVYQELTFNGESVDAILMDFEMPVMNGPTATKKLRELGCTCLIIGVTGNILPDQVASFKSNGADAVLPKPLMMEDLQALLRDGTVDDSTPPMRLMTKHEAKTDYSPHSSSQVYPES